jgi:ABC-2 type transport system permease protein
MFLFVPVFLVLGYIFYGSMFIALGAVAESMQDASTLMTPMVLIMTACIGVVPIGLSYPDSPIVVFGQWFPFSAPFAAIVRLPADPPVWETLGSAISLILASILVIWLSSRVFQQGVLSGGGISSVKTWFTTKVLRRSLPK